MPEIDPVSSVSSQEHIESVARREQLTAYFLDIASCQGRLQDETLEYVQSGGSVRLCLSEIQKLSEPSGAEKDLADDRAEYIQQLLTPTVMPRRRKRSDGYVRSIYIDGVVAKVESVLDAQTPQQALALGQMPTIVSKTSFDDDAIPDAETLAANHLYVLVDTALREHSDRRSLIDEYTQKGFISRVLGNRIVRMVLAGGVFVSSLSPQLHFIPVESEAVARDLEVGLTIISASVFGLDAPEEVRWRYLDIAHAKQAKRLHEALAENKQLSDLALRMSYNATRYGAGNNFVTGRTATDDKQANLQRFEALDDEFKHLNNDPGGKPYSGDQALGYAARILVERNETFAALIAPGATAEDRRKVYLHLVREIITEDVMRMEKGLSASGFRHALLRVVGLVPALILSPAFSAANDATARGRDVVNVGRQHHND
jgi:hypothetical protein